VKVTYWAGADASRFPLIALGALFLLYLVAPLFGLVSLSGTDVLAVLRDPQTQSAVGTSLLTATVSTAIMAIFGVPLAYALARLRFPGRTLVSIAVFLPLVLPPVSAGILLLMLYGPYGVVGHLLAPWGIGLTDTASGIVLAQIFVAAPFVVVAARASFERIEREYEEAAASMGATVWQTFWHVALPMARGGVAAGLILGWMRALGEFGATVILAYHPYSLPVLNYVNLTSTGLSAALPLALVALVIAATVVLLLFIVQGEELGVRRR